MFKRMTLTPEQIDRFTSKYVVDATTECWLWQAAASQGYGVIRINYVLKRAHRVSYEHHVGPIPDGLQLDHLCRNRRCVNPAHLEPVTQQENILRGESVSVGRSKVTHCPRGHEYAGDNLFYSKRNQRMCRECSRWFARRTRQRRKERDA